MLTILIALTLTIMQPCPTEDSSPCYWDASAHGTTGRDFVALSEDAVLYVPLP